MTFSCPADHFLGYDRSLTELTLECDDATGQFQDFPPLAVCYDQNGTVAK